jgi:putative ABC transport system ATP-binding protein
MDSALETRSATKTYESADAIVRAVDSVSVHVHHGELVALVGPSGSGKTTLLALLAGLLRPTDGHVLIEGHELGKMRERTAFRREKIGFVFQASNLVPYLTARENVELMLQLNGTLDPAARTRAQVLLERLGLADRMHHLPGQLSGGQQQRVAIARALIHEPTLVLADEPTASLDTERAHQVVETLAALVHEQNRAGVMVTHDLRMCRYADRVIQMVDGRVERTVVGRAEILVFAGEAPPSIPRALALGAEQHPEYAAVA